MFNNGDGPTGIYSEHKVKQVAWIKHYEKFWIGSNGFCGWRWPMCFTNNSADYRGPTPQAEPRFFNAVTGKNITFADGMELGRKIFTLDRAIWTIQGRHRDMEVFPDYVYEQSSRGEVLPVYDDKTRKWSYSAGSGRKLDRAKVEEWKTRFYEFEGFNKTNGWPKRETLEDMGLTRIIHESSTAAADPGVSTALRSVGLLDVLLSTPAESSVARLVSTPACAASLRTFMNNAG